MKYYLKKGMFWTKKENEIIVYYTNSSLRKGIRSSDNEKLFQLLTILSEPKTYSELVEAAPFEKKENLDATLSYLLSKGYIAVQERDVQKVENRVRSFVDSIPNVSYNDYSLSIEKTHICIIGTGTAGSYIPECLIKLGLNRFTLIDPDKVEENNLYAQNFSFRDVGRYKVEVLKHKYENEFKTSNITAIIRQLSNYEDLKHAVALEEIDYLALCADNNTLIIDVLENIFLDFPNIKIIISGYAVFQQHCYLIDRETNASILKEIKQNVRTLNELDEVIVENSGVIFDSLFSAISISKIIFDHVLNINSPKIAKADFLNNRYFIGNEDEYKIHEEYEHRFTDQTVL
ncbi:MULTISPECIES: ThiF family adenylyltransferase [unclassified Bacillus (in: firmicutes)]|uniref:ThiF family adenylyltransferase n=1 Tax=unclassified Bacillus (in: firmicutes) TaxID=185979 RepID=UPI0003FFCBD7|nr:ThiF family adenylyltransferase [Bacillus sp. NSP9.1]QHZ45035.1 hypothetical protein M654_001350 [Bacillus sp. NSP9.1]